MKEQKKQYKHCKNCVHLRSSHYHSKDDGYFYVCQIKHKYFEYFLRLRAKYCELFEQREEGDEFSYEPRFKPKKNN